MNSKSLLSAGFTLLVACLAGASAQMVPANDRVRIEVRVASEQDRKEIAKTSADTVTQHKTLNISITGKPKSPETRTGKWTAYGHSAKGHDYTAIESGEFKIDLSNQGRQTVESKKVSTTYTPEYSVVSRGRSGGGGGGRSKAKKVEATGTKYAGYIIEVKDGANVAGQAADPMGLPKEVSK